MAVQQELWQTNGTAFPPAWAVIQGDPPALPRTIWPMGPPAMANSRL